MPPFRISLTSMWTAAYDMYAWTGLRFHRALNRDTKSPLPGVLIVAE